MPWSYTVNLSLYYVHKHKQNEKEILLPDATIRDKTKSVVVLVIGESARSQNFSLYGYKKNTKSTGFPKYLIYLILTLPRAPRTLVRVWNVF